MSHDSSLEPSLRAVEPAARLVTERHLRQVLHYLIDADRPLASNPELPVWVARTDLVAAEVLPSHVLTGTEPTLLLITDPTDRMIDHLPRAEQLRGYWELLFEAAVGRALDEQARSGAIKPGEFTERLNRFGPAAAREIRYVLLSEHRIWDGAGDAACYRAFAALYLRAAAFEHHRLDELFPSLPHGDAVGRSIAEVVDSTGLLARTRPDGAADPHREPSPDERWASDDPGFVPPPATPAEPGGLLGKALEAERAGNRVRAAILRTQVATGATGTAADQARAGARADLGSLVDGLGEMFGWDHETRQEWRQALRALLEPASVGVWPRAARCLYELQKIPADLSREVFAVELAETIRTLGRRPVKRPLPRAKPVLILMGLKKAHTQLLRAGLGHAAQLRLDRLFLHQIHRLERDIRHLFTPIIVDTLTASGLVCANTVEEVAREKVVAELLDRVCDRGYLRIGDLRDAIARNQLKMPDLKGVGEFFTGDPLLKTDTNLAYALDGVYRKGEFYLRWLQRASSVFFANAVGRAAFLYLLLPFVGAFMTVVGAMEMAHLAADAYKFAAKHVAPKSATPPPAEVAAERPPAGPRPRPDDDRVDEDDVEADPETGEFFWHQEPNQVERARAFGMKVLFSSSATPTKKGGHPSFHVPWGWVGGLAAVLFLTLHVSPFRRGLVAAIRYLWWAVRGVLWDLPVAAWRSPAVRGVRQSRPVRLAIRLFWSPLLLAAILFAVLLLIGVRPHFLVAWGWAIWAGLTLAYNTPWGWVVQDRVAEAVSDWWRVVRVNLIPGLVATIIDWFRALANWVERKLYAVDERLRFRGGDSNSSLAAKAALGLVWFPVAYVTRFAFYLLIEPQINPIKHFPVVTVSHKLILPLFPTVAEVLGVSNKTAVILLGCVPGVFGFVAWELLANWRLYRANRDARLRPVTLGSHGESMRGLLRPGFHSGTVPKLFRKMRHADRTRAGRWHHDLEHAAEGVHRFVERELVHLLARSPEWGGVALHVDAVRFGCQRASVGVSAPALGPGALVVAFENVAGRIEAGVEPAPWAGKLTDPQRAVLADALRGLLDMAAVEAVGGHERADSAAAGPGVAGLARTVSWAEWVARWTAKPGSA